MITKLKNIFKKKVKECDHIYFPVPDDNGWYAGQECSLCKKFNSMETLGLPTAPNPLFKSYW
jgi:hypothetical protein